MVDGGDYDFGVGGEGEGEGLGEVGEELGCRGADDCVANQKVPIDIALEMGG